MKSSYFFHARVELVLLRHVLVVVIQLLQIAHELLLLAVEAQSARCWLLLILPPIERISRLIFRVSHRFHSARYSSL